METLVWDASALHHVARAERLDVLGDMVKAHDNVTTAAVIEELDRYGLAERVSEGGWLRVVHVDGLTELAALVRWVGLLSGGVHDRGEATVCAWAEVHGATAILDDADAKAAAVHGGLDVHGSLWVVARAVRDGLLAEAAAEGLVNTLIREGANFPRQVRSRGFAAWARSMKLL